MLLHRVPAEIGLALCLPARLAHGERDESTVSRARIRPNGQAEAK
jgi:hypothetical protein